MANLERLSALGTSDSGPGTMEFSDLSIHEHLPRTIVQLNGAGQPEVLQAAFGYIGLSASDAGFGKAISGAGVTALWNGPGMWMLVQQEERAGLVAELNERLDSTDATATDLSHSRTVLRVNGANALNFLATGCPMDLEKCDPDTAVSTQFGHFNVLMHLINSTTADLYVYRSFGQALWEHCHHAGEEFG